MPPAVGGVRQRDMAMTRVLGLRRAPRLRASQPVGPAMMAGTATLTRDVAVMEEERRVKLWKAKFSLADGEVAALRASFEEVLKANPSEARTLPKDKMKLVIEKTQVKVDAVDVGNEGRPVVQPDELQSYITALPPLWAETCEQDAVEVANGECQVELDLENFDLSETLAIFGMCLREHCGIGGVCFWDTPNSAAGGGGKW